MHKITDRQLEVLSFIKSYIKRVGIPPSRLDITEFFGWNSKNAAQDHLIFLEKKGYLKIIPNVSRGIKITNKGKKEK